MSRGQRCGKGKGVHLKGEGVQRAEAHLVEAQAAQREAARRRRAQPERERPRASDAHVVDGKVEQLERGERRVAQAATQRRDADSAQPIAGERELGEPRRAARTEGRGKRGGPRVAERGGIEVQLAQRGRRAAEQPVRHHGACAWAELLVVAQVQALQLGAA